MFRLLKWLIIFGIIIGLYFFYPNILKVIGNYLIVNDPLEKSDVILVLSGDNRKGERVSEAVKLFKKGYGKYLVLSGNKFAWETYAADIMERQALSLKVPKSAIIPIRTEAESTIGEAKVLQEVLEKKHIKSIILVTSSYHTRRAKWIFSKIFKRANIKISVHPANDSEYDADHWWEKRLSAEAIFYEYTKFFWYKAVERFNLEDSKKSIKAKEITQQVQ